MIKNNRGQSLIESAVLLPMIVSLTSLLLMALYFLIVTQWGDYCVYQTSVCLVEGQTERQCRQTLEQRLQILLPQKYFNVVKIWKTPHKVSVAVNIQFVFFNANSLTLQKKLTSQISLPLRSTTIPEL